MTWTLESALVYIRALQPKAMEAGWCILLAGGVLNNGASENDLDLLAYPKTRASKRADLLALLPSPGEWSQVEGVSDVFAYGVEGGRVELIFQLTSSAESPPEPPVVPFAAYVERIVAELHLRVHWPGLVWVDADSGCGVDGCVRERMSRSSGLDCLACVIEVQTGRGPRGDRLLIRDGVGGTGDHWDVARTPEAVAAVAARIQESARDRLARDEQDFIARRRRLDLIAGVRP